MKLIIPLLSVLGFLWLAQVSQQEHGYTDEEREALEHAIESALAEDEAEDWLTLIARAHNI